MRTDRDVIGDATRFLLLDVPPEYEEAVLVLGFTLIGNAFARAFPNDVPNLDEVYANFGRHAEEMIRQAAGLAEAPWRTALMALLGRLEGRPIAWWLTGSGALAVRGIDVQPRDLDLVVDERGATELGVLLADTLVEPVVSVKDWICRWWGRAFLHVRIEWVGGVDDRADDSLVTDFGPTAASRLETVTWNGRIVRVPPLDLQLAVSERRGLRDRAARIRDLLGRGGSPARRLFMKER
jgi:hypothetical protein